MKGGGEQEGWHKEHQQVCQAQDRRLDTAPRVRWTFSLVPVLPSTSSVTLDCVRIGQGHGRVLLWQGAGDQGRLSVENLCYATIQPTKSWSVFYCHRKLLVSKHTPSIVYE